MNDEVIFRYVSYSKIFDKILVTPFILFLNCIYSLTLYSYFQYPEKIQADFGSFIFLALTTSLQFIVLAVFLLFNHKIIVFSDRVRIPYNFTFLDIYYKDIKEMKYEKGKKGFYYLRLKLSPNLLSFRFWLSGRRNLFDRDMVQFITRGKSDKFKQFQDKLIENTGLEIEVL